MDESHHVNLFSLKLTIFLCHPSNCLGDRHSPSHWRKHDFVRQLSPPLRGRLMRMLWSLFSNPHTHTNSAPYVVPLCTILHYHGLSQEMLSHERKPTRTRPGGQIDQRPPQVFMKEAALRMGQSGVESRGGEQGWRSVVESL